MTLFGVAFAGAHMFWWLYYSEIITKSNLPLVLWLQGGPVSTLSLFHRQVVPLAPLSLNFFALPTKKMRLLHRHRSKNKIDVC